jgi:hypothetical protein
LAGVLAVLAGVLAVATFVQNSHIFAVICRRSADAVQAVNDLYGLLDWRQQLAKTEAHLALHILFSSLGIYCEISSSK